MNRQFTIVGACVIVLGLLTLVVIRGGKRTHPTEPPRDNNFSVTVEMPKTNAAAKAGSR